jgi:flagellar basal body-associated protein FliL
MKDEIDLFFDQHRNTFRSEDPPEGHEHRFRLKLEGQSSKGKQRFMTWLPLAWAASLILAVLAGAFFFSNQDSSGAKDYVKTRKHFESLVEQQESILVSMNQEVTGHWYADVENQLDKLQSNQKQLQDDSVKQVKTRAFYKQ